jgi:hypothetical protein
MLARRIHTVEALKQAVRCCAGIVSPVFSTCSNNGPSWRTMVTVTRPPGGCGAGHWTTGCSAPCAA